jgi:hypothetical protein
MFVSVPDAQRIVLTANAPRLRIPVRGDTAGPDVKRTADDKCRLTPTPSRACHHFLAPLARGIDNAHGPSVC